MRGGRAEWQSECPRLLEVNGPADVLDLLEATFAFVPSLSLLIAFSIT